MPSYRSPLPQGIQRYNFTGAILNLYIGHLNLDEIHQLGEYFYYYKYCLVIQLASTFTRFTDMKVILKPTTLAKNAT